MFPFLLIGSIALQIWAWRRLIGRVKAGTLTGLRGTTRYTGWAFLPVVLFVTIYLVMVGLEEWWHVALVEERTALLFLPVCALSVAGSIGFAVNSVLVRKAQH